MNVTRTRIVATILAAAVVGLAACDEGNEPSPTTPATQPANPPSSAALPSGALAAVQACELVTEAEATTISKGIAFEDLGAGSGATSGCQWSTSIDRGVPPDEGVVFSINIRPGQTVDEASARGGAQVTDGDVEGRAAKQIAGNDGIEGSCLLTFAAESGRVDINVERTNQPTDKACDDASKVSTLIEPKLPE